MDEAGAEIAQVETAQSQQPQPASSDQGPRQFVSAPPVSRESAAAAGAPSGGGFGVGTALVLDESLLGAAQAGGGGAEGDADGPEPFTPTGHVDAGLLMRM